MDVLTDQQIKHMAEQFLRWRLPDPWHPDGGITFEPRYNVNNPYGWPEGKHEPTGTNLFDYTQAVAMIRHMLDGLPAATPAPQGEKAEPVAWTNRANLRVLKEPEPLIYAVMHHENTPEWNIPLFRHPEFERSRRSAPSAPVVEEGVTVWSSDWDKAPRDGRYVWLWQPGYPPKYFRWSDHYSVFGLGGCWTDGLATMGEGIDFTHWAYAPQPPTERTVAESIAFLKEPEGGM